MMNVVLGSVVLKDGPERGACQGLYSAAQGPYMAYMQYMLHLAGLAWLAGWLSADCQGKVPGQGVVTRQMADTKTDKTHDITLQTTRHGTEDRGQPLFPTAWSPRGAGG